VSDRAYLDHMARINADNVTATIEAWNDDGSYMVREVASGALLRASTSNPTDQFRIGARVTVSRPSASRTVLGAGAVIISRAPVDQKGLSASTPAVSSAFHDLALIISCDPDPLVLVAGGSPGEQTIIGRGLTEAATYEGSGGRPDPALTESAAPTIEPAKVVMSISADAACPLGDFDARLNGAIARNALRVIAPTGREPPYLVVSGLVTLADTSTLAVAWVLDPEDLGLLARFEVAADQSYGLVRRGAETYWITSTGTDFRARTINPRTGTMTDAPLDAHVSFTLHEGSELGLLTGYRLMLASVSGAQKGLWLFFPSSDTTGGDEWFGTREWTDVTLGTGRIGIATDDASIYLCGFNGTVKIDIDSLAQVAINATPTGQRIVAVRSWADGVYGAFTGALCVAGTDAVRWLDASDLSVTATFAVGGSDFRGPVQINEALYFVNITSGLLHRAALDGSAVDDVDTLALLGDAYALASDGADLFYLRSDSTARKIRTDGATSVTSAALDSSTPSDSVTLQQALFVGS
jgi:hypothetical protein